MLKDSMIGAIYQSTLATEFKQLGKGLIGKDRFLQVVFCSGGCVHASIFVRNELHPIFHGALGAFEC
jgi:hypothetical protein